MCEYILCGIDAHEKTLVTSTAVDKEPAVNHPYVHNAEGVRALVRDLRRQAQEAGGGRLVVAYEASSLGFGLYDRFHEEGLSCHVLAPHKIRQSAEDRKKKTDARDAERILDQLRNGYLAGSALPAVWVPDRQTREDRQLVRAHFELGEKLSEIKTRMRMWLKVNGVEVQTLGLRPWSQGYRRALRRLVQRPERLEASLVLVLESHLKLLEVYEQQRQRLQEAIEQLSQSPRYRLAVNALREQVYGVGLITAMVFLTELGPLGRFANRRQIGAYLGLSPSSFESGACRDRKGHITGYGPFRVRKVLCQSVWCQVRNGQGEARVYERLVGRNPRKKKIAVVACMRRLAIRMWHVGKEAQRGVVTPREPVA